MKLGLLLCALACLGAARAGTVTTPELCRLMYAARLRVVVYAPTVQSARFGECLRKAVVNYRRNVIVLTVPYFNQDGDSLVNALALAGVKVYEAQVDSLKSVVLIDGYTFTGEGIGMDDDPEITLLSENATPAYVGDFKRILKTARFVSRFVVDERTKR